MLRLFDANTGGNRSVDLVGVAGMSMSDYRLEDGIEVIGNGKGWSVWHEPSTGRWRFDVLGGDIQRAIPALGYIYPIQASEFVDRLWVDAGVNPELITGVQGLRAFVASQWPRSAKV